MADASPFAFRAISADDGKSRRLAELRVDFVDERGDAVFSLRLRQQQRQAQQGHHDRRPCRQPGSAHGGRHLQLPLPQVPPQSEKARRQQQTERRGDVDGEQTEPVRAGLRVVRRNEQLPDAENGQCGQRKIDDPFSGSVHGPIGRGRLDIGACPRPRFPRIAHGRGRWRAPSRRESRRPATGLRRRRLRCHR